MSSTQQYLLDAYRARQLGEPAPPAPGESRVVREWRERRRFRAVLAGRRLRGGPRLLPRRRRSRGSGALG
ncbi:hypothetical protein [Streptomyces parvulus]|uniref:hypothetical protein n=1 Tax=Streptomyces parvulus TaxID=146923 RepID=UPI00369B7B1F